ncbi:MAG: methyltransferase domain-containing protein [Pseudomonadales bacterium]|nr:methyltransferase domain-containing protein [Pseudomonadales bacterium]
MSEHGLPEGFFKREDESDDARFYALPRFTKHIDDATIAALTAWYRDTLKPSWRILDLMSSWISHLPNEIRYRHVSGHGMNEDELARNERLDDYWVQDLNREPHLPCNDAAYDAVLITVSIQYLIRPFEVFEEIGRVLAPDGLCIVAMSHRLFPEKAIQAFKVLPPVERIHMVASYMEKSGHFGDIELVDRSPRNADPLWIVQGKRI